MICLGAELAVLLLFAVQDVSGRQDAVAVNEVLHNVQYEWGHMESLPHPSVSFHTYHPVPECFFFFIYTILPSK